MSAQTAGPDFEGVLLGHRSLIQVGQAKACTCGWEDGFVADVSSAHRAHVASALRAEVGRWLGSEGAVSVAARAANDAPNGAWLVLPGPVNIARSLVQPALAALAEQVGRVASVGEGEECTCNPAEVENGVCVLCGKRFPVGDGV